MRDEAVMKSALAEYAEGKTTTKTIADKYGVCASTLTVWAQQSGIKLRKRGRTLAKEPTERQKEMLALVPGQSYAEIGKQFGVCKQEVGRTVKRWASYIARLHMDKKKKCASA